MTRDTLLSYRCLLLVFLVTGLLACQSVPVVGSLLHDDRDFQTIAEDKALELKASRILNGELGADADAMLWVSHDLELLLLGPLPNRQQRQRVDVQLSRLDNLRAVFDYSDALPPRDEKQRQLDQNLGERIRDAISAQPGWNTMAVRVLVYRQRIYLMGHVTQHAALLKAISRMDQVQAVVDLLNKSNKSSVSQPTSI